MSAPRIAILGFVLEANRNAPVSDREIFEETLYLESDGILAELAGDRKGLPSTVQGFCEEMDVRGVWDPMPILLAEAPPGGPADHTFFMNMIETMQVWKEAGYFGAFCHDHTPHFSRDGGGDTGIAFAVGFMRCCIQVAYAEHVRRSADEFTSYHQRR